MSDARTLPPDLEERLEDLCNNLVDGSPVFVSLYRQPLHAYLDEVIARLDSGVRRISGGRQKVHRVDAARIKDMPRNYTIFIAVVDKVTSTNQVYALGEFDMPLFPCELVANEIYQQRLAEQAAADRYLTQLTRGEQSLDIWTRAQARKLLKLIVAANDAQRKKDAIFHVGHIGASGNNATFSDLPKIASASNALGVHFNQLVEWDTRLDTPEAVLQGLTTR